MESRSHRVVCLIIGLWIINAFDLALTLLAHDQGFLAEQNPLAEHFLARGPVSVALFKIGLVLIGSYPLLRFRNVRVAEMGALVVLLMYVSVAFRWNNCYKLYAIAASPPANYAELQEALDEIEP